MKRLSWKKMLSVLALAVLYPGMTAQATDPGMVRISDQPPTSVKQVGTSSHSGLTPVRVGPNAGIYTQDPGPVGTRRAPSPTYVWIAGDGSVSYSPDYGYTRPVKYPVMKVPVEYYRYYPTYAYGDPRAQYPSAYPEVYMPMDTTQLGYTYQYVPTWRPRPEMIPTQPWPLNWHHREAPLGHRGGFHSQQLGSSVIVSPASPATPTLAPEPVLEDHPILPEPVPASENPST